MATYKTGMVDTEDVLAGERVEDVSEIVHKLQPDYSQFKLLLEKIGSKPAIREKVTWLEEQLQGRVSALAVSATSADTAFTVTTGDGNTIFRPGDVIRNTLTGEACLVSSVSANSVGVTRSWGGVGAASSVSANAQLVVVGNAAAQGASSGTAQYVQRTIPYNYVQDQRNALFFSDFQTAIKLYGGGEPTKELARLGAVHNRAIENTLFFGARDIDTSASPGPQGSCGGVVEFLTTSVSATSGGVLTPSNFETFLEPIAAKGTGNLAIFAAPRPSTVLSQMYRDKWVPPTTGTAETYGAKVTAFIHATYGGTIPVFTKKEWSDMGTSASGQYGTWLFVIDMGNIRLRTLVGEHDVGMNKLRMNIQEPSSTGIVHEYRSCFSLEFGVESAHGVLKNVTSYAAS